MPTEAVPPPTLLCERYELSKGGLLKILGEHGVKMRNQPMTEEEIDWAVKLYGRAIRSRPSLASSARRREACGQRFKSGQLPVIVGRQTVATHCSTPDSSSNQSILESTLLFRAWLGYRFLANRSACIALNISRITSPHPRRSSNRRRPHRRPDVLQPRQNLRVYILTPPAFMSGWGWHRLHLVRIRFHQSNDATVWIGLFRIGCPTLIVTVTVTWQELVPARGVHSSPPHPDSEAQHGREEHRSGP